jgi:hypothetical protein
MGLGQTALLFGGAALLLYGATHGLIPVLDGPGFVAVAFGLV